MQQTVAKTFRPANILGSVGYYPPNAGVLKDLPFPESDGPEKQEKVL